MPTKTMNKQFSLLLAILATLIFVTSCSKDSDSDLSKPSLDKTNITLYASEEAKLTYTGNTCDWSSDNELVATVSNGVVTAKHVGTTTIHANDLTCMVTVKPKYLTYVEPCILWGSSKSLVKSYMQGYALKGEESNSLGYIGKGNVNGYVYLFDNNGLKESAFVVSLLNSIKISDFLLERYWVIDLKEDGDGDLISYLGSVDLKTYIVLNIKKDGVVVDYLSTESLKEYSTKRAAQIDKSQLMKEHIYKWYNLK
jgi:hypothetical protein